VHPFTLSPEGAEDLRGLGPGPAEPVRHLGVELIYGLMPQLHRLRVRLLSRAASG